MWRGSIEPSEGMNQPIFTKSHLGFLLQSTWMEPSTDSAPGLSLSQPFSTFSQYHLTTFDPPPHRSLVTMTTASPSKVHQTYLKDPVAAISCQINLLHLSARVQGNTTYLRRGSVLRNRWSWRTSEVATPSLSENTGRVGYVERVRFYLENTLDYQKCSNWPLTKGTLTKWLH